MGWGSEKLLKGPNYAMRVRQIEKEVLWPKVVQHLKYAPGTLDGRAIITLNKFVPKYAEEMCFQEHGKRSDADLMASEAKFHALLKATKVAENAS
tara:strand:- start:1328 stop:1612 length:285 start_codon:yes stop_codon:yes gene_type:complete